MPGKLRFFFSRFVGVLFVLFLLQNSLFLQVRPGDLAKKYPEIEGLYEMAVPGAETIFIQFYFKDGTLRTVEKGDSASTKWDPVEGQEPKFTTVSQKRGMFHLEFLKDEQGRYTRYRVVNETIKMDVTGTKKSGLDDTKADPASPSDRLGYFERHYRKSEHRIPMRDGIRLFTQVYSPIDQSELHPIILFRTPYGIPPYGESFRSQMFPGLFFAKENYILVYQDIRGMSMSEGTFEFIRPYNKDKKTASDVDESSDAYDTVEWLLKNTPSHNGKIGVWGVSYPGFTAAMAAISAHPAILAVSPQAPMADLFLGDDGHHNGALYLAHYANYLYSAGQIRKEPTVNSLPRFRFPTPDGYSFYLQLGPLKNITEKIFDPTNKPWNDAMAHETYDVYWKARSIYQHLRDIKPAILTVGGWYDAEDLLGTLLTYKTIEKENPGLPNTIVMGPWFHSGWNLLAGGSEDRGVFPFSGTKTYFQEKIELPFFNYYLKGKRPLNLPEAVVFETGTDQWRSYDAWPPAEAKEKKLFFANNGRVSFDQAPESPDAGFDEYLSDPAKPVPYTMQTTAQYYRDYFVEDQRFAASRPDVLVYSGETLTEDVTITGPIKAELYVSTTGTDADWVVKVIDVYPDNSPDPKTNPGNIRMGGYQRLIRGDVIRGKFRNSFEKPEPFVPNRVTKVEFELPDVQHAFLKGHRIMIQIQSSWFPLFDRNPQTFCNIRKAGEQDFRKATHRLYRTRQYPSGIKFRVLTK
jgi:putative CocE/NonD family hydrolase